MKEYGIGTLAYIDSFGGLIKCKVLSIEKRRNEDITGIIETMVTVKVTVDRGGYHRGEIVTKIHESIIPRSSVYVSGGKYKIRNDYTWRVK